MAPGGLAPGSPAGPAGPDGTDRSPDSRGAGGTEAGTDTDTGTGTEAGSDTEAAGRAAAGGLGHRGGTGRPAPDHPPGSRRAAAGRHPVMPARSPTTIRPTSRRHPSRCRSWTRSPRARGLGLLGGPGYLLVATLVGLAVSDWAALVAIAAFIGGFVTLVLRMGDRPPRRRR